MNLNKPGNLLSKIVILGFMAGFIHFLYIKFIANPYSPVSFHIFAIHSLKYFNTWLLISPFLILFIYIVKIIWDFLFKHPSKSNLKNKIQSYGSMLLGCIAGCLFLLYGGWAINRYFLPSKFHPLSLLGDVGILLFSLLLGWGVRIILTADKDNKLRKLIIGYYKVTALVLVILLAALNSYVFSHFNKIPKRPNVLFVLIDALRADHLSSYGYSRNTSPNIDNIAREGVLFSNAISSAPWTVPSMASIHTSVNPSVHGVLRNSAALGVLSDDFVTLAEHLAEINYETAGIVSNPWLNGSYKINQGFQTYEMVDWNNAGKLTSKALSWLDKRPSNPFFLSWLHNNNPLIPFFLYLHYMDVHGPYDRIPSPYNNDFLENTNSKFNRELTEEEIKKIPGYWGLTDLKKTNLNFYVTRYDQEIRYVDTELKKVISKIDKLGLLNDTLIVITADHGIEFLEHGDWDMGRNLHDEDLHVPLIMRLPSRLPRNFIINDQVRLIDIMPTLLGMLNVPVHNNINGKNLSPLIFQKDQLNLNAFSEAIDRDPLNYVKSLRTEKFKLIYNTNTQSAKLYDLETDPKESVNLYQDKNYKNQFNKVYSQLNSNMKANSFLKEQYKENQMLNLNEDMKKQLRSLGYVQ